MENIDFAAFSQNEFDPVEWLNSIFVPNADNNNDNKRKTMANNLVFKLQLMVEETNNSLQEIAQRMSLSMPKVIGEADVLSREATELLNQIVDVRTKLICSEQQHLEVIDALVQMDRAKRRLQDLYQALQEANNWSVLSTDVEEVFESGDVVQISSKISSMQKSLELLSIGSSNGVQLNDKIELLENLKDRFEKLIEPMLLDAFSKSSSESIEFYSNLFKEFHRSDRLIRYYHSCLRDQLLKEWSTQVMVDSEGTILDKLNFLYDRLNMIWKTQMNFCMKVLYPDDFGMSLEVLCDIFTDITLSLSPSIESFVDRFLNEYTNKQVNKQKSLIELKQFTNSFIRNIELNILSLYTPSGQQQEDINQLINRIKPLDSFIRTIYHPFAKLNEKFILYEKERLDDEFDEIRAKYEDLISNPCVSKIFSLIRDSFKLYCLYVESYPLLIVEDVIEDFLLKYLNSSNQTKSWIREDLKDTAVKKSSSNPTMSSPNWSHIQQTLFKYQSYGDFVNQFFQFQQQAHSTFLEYRNRTQNQSDNETQTINFFRRFDYFILNLDFNTELRDRIEAFIQNPNILMNQVITECVELIKVNAQDICQAMFDYIQIQLNHFDTYIEQELKQLEPSSNQENSDQILKEQESINESLTYSPNEYITQIGQYLMMLPQHLEPFNLNENPCFKSALHYSSDIFQNFSSDNNIDASVIQAPTELLLECILRKTIRSLLEHIQRIPLKLSKMKRSSKLTMTIRKQIATDLSYLAVVCEDLGFARNRDIQFLIVIQMFNGENNLLTSKVSIEKLKQDNRSLEKLICNIEELII